MSTTKAGAGPGAAARASGSAGACLRRALSSPVAAEIGIFRLNKERKRVREPCGYVSSAHSRDIFPTIFQFSMAVLDLPHDASVRTCGLICSTRLDTNEKLVRAHRVGAPQSGDRGRSRICLINASAVSENYNALYDNDDTEEGLTGLA
ncbi:hypothetical protein EVAR_14444_1 [Eumeta japonica]|uniref:Uncharacterized protein n=1 Tax=Eumeta variegata TaxID=151549 RepID=A0A4C1TXT0_EUMVA|nr:hypothetical protein EVAR_14444_1 [Eumeta japonica]